MHQGKPLLDRFVHLRVTQCEWDALARKLKQESRSPSEIMRQLLRENHLSEGNRPPPKENFRTRLMNWRGILS
jgi:hypothetical protein